MPNGTLVATESPGAGVTNGTSGAAARPSALLPPDRTRRVKGRMPGHGRSSARWRRSRRVSVPPAPPASSPAARAVMQGNRGSGTRPEQLLRSVLLRRGLRFRKHCAPVAGLRCRADIVFPSARLAVFVDGCFWHGCPDHGVSPRTNAAYLSAKIARNIERDREQEEALAAAGWSVLRLWEHVPPEDAADRVLAALSSATDHRIGRSSTAAPAD